MAQPETKPTPQPNPLNSRRLLVMLALIIALWLAVLPGSGAASITEVYYTLQDRFVLGGMVVALLLLAWRQPKWQVQVGLTGRAVPLAAALLLAIGLWIGTYAVMLDYPLTRDEHMVVFDAHNFSQGRLSSLLPADWAGFALGFVPDFMLDAPGDVVLASAYGPGNAAMRAAFGQLLDPALMNPVLAAIGLVALIDCARRLFPDTPQAVWVSAAAYILSAQMLVNAMTTYAMTAHLALNMIWLALFLRGGKWALAGTMVIGAWAIGLHQVIFHPLFAGPFILTLLLQRRWGLFATYAAIYGAALLFWMSYPALVMDQAGVQAASGTGTGGSGFLQERVLPLLLERDPNTIGYTLYNLIRFVGWNALFLIPLAAMAWPAIKRVEGFALPLGAGIFLTFAAMVLLLPYQGHGYGYRYFHAVLGNWFLLAGYGYCAWAARDRAVAAGSTAVMAGLSAILAIPFLLLTSHNFVKPYVSLDRLIDRQTADFVIIDTEKPHSAIDQARNWPDLSNRPLRLSSDDLSAEQVVELCRRGTVALIRRQDFHRAGFVPDLPEESPLFDRKIEGVAGQNCIMPTVN